MVLRASRSDMIEIIGNKPVPYGYRKDIIPGMYFASAVARKERVSFYFFPIYSKPEKYRSIAPELLKSLKGKTCFNFKKVEDVNRKELKTLLMTGVKAWKEMGYMK